MSKTLSPAVQDMITAQDIKIKFIIKINDIDYTDYLLSFSINHNKEFGSASATFTLNNNDGIFGEGGVSRVYVGDVVSFSEYYGNDSTEWKQFYGKVNQRSIAKSNNNRSITLVCLDYISVLQFLDVDLEVEGTKVLVENETLTPNYLPAPNDSLAHIFDFANDSIADDPLPILMIKNKDTAEEDPQYDGYEMQYDNGQVKLGSPLNAKDNYDLIAVAYYFYTKGEWIEDILEDILILVDGYGNYLFGETSAQAVIDNHLTDTFNNVEDRNIDTLVPNYTNSSITVYTTLAVAVTAGSTSITLTDGSGFPNSGQGSINGDIFTWLSKTGDNTLLGIPSVGTYALKAHPVGSYAEYTNTYSPGQVWY